MRFFERNDDRQRNDPPSGGDSNNLLDALRQEANQFLDAGDEAINRALADGNSEDFLQASRQQGGE
jgi:hypothetical protein